MKKLILGLLAFLLVGNIMAQGTFKIGVMGGIPLSDANDISNLVLGADAYYMIGKRSAIVRFGPTVGVRNFFGKEISPGVDAEDAQFLPVSLAGRVNILGILKFGVDAGYAVGLSDFLDGGLYVKPMLTLGILRIIEINFGYEYIDDNATWSSANIGVLLVI